MHCEKRLSLNPTVNSDSSYLRVKTTSEALPLTPACAFKSLSLVIYTYGSSPLSSTVGELGLQRRPAVYGLEGVLKCCRSPTIKCTIVLHIPHRTNLTCPPTGLAKCHVHNPAGCNWLPACLSDTQHMAAGHCPPLWPTQSPPVVLGFPYLSNKLQLTSVYSLFLAGPNDVIRFSR